MPILIFLLTVAAGAYFWFSRAQNAARGARDVADAAGDALNTVLNAPRRIAFRRAHGQHPVEGIEDPRVAICAIAQSFLELDDLPTKEQRDRLNVLVRSRLRADPEEATEMQVLGRWLQGQCDGPEPAITRLTRRLWKLDQGNSTDMLLDILGALASDDGLSVAQERAVRDIRVSLHMKSNL